MITAKFEIHYQQFLNEQGELVQSEIPDFAQNPETLIDLYRTMVTLRLFDTKAVALQRTGKLGTYAGILGQEAISTSMGHAMQKDDALCPSYRDYGAFIQRGCKMEDILRFWGGDERGSNFDNANDFPITVPISSQCLHAAGIAVAFKYRKQKRVALTICGDGGTSKGDFYEAMNLAGDWQLPMVFVVNNNQWAISVPRNNQTGALTIAQKAIAAGFDSIQVDGNDIIAVRHAVGEAIDKARRGEGPSLIEAISYRLCDHTTADDAKRYRPDYEVEEAWQKEPIKRLRTYLMNINAWDETKEQALIEECTQSVETSVQNYLNTPPDKATAMFDHLYEHLPDAYLEQYEELMEDQS